MIATCKELLSYQTSSESLLKSSQNSVKTTLALKILSDFVQLLSSSIESPDTFHP